MRFDGEKPFSLTITPDFDEGASCFIGQLLKRNLLIIQPYHCFSLVSLSLVISSRVFIVQNREGQGPKVAKKADRPNRRSFMAQSIWIHVKSIYTSFLACSIERLGL
jgi:hypothetical protein